MQESPPAPKSIPLITSISKLAPPREAWLVDVWGVMHNGAIPFAAASDACARFRLGGGIVLLLSNAPRPSSSVVAQLDRIGVPRFAYDAILTSGDAARALVAAFGDRRVFPLGPERDMPLYEGLGVVLTDAETAQAVCCTGLFDDEVETPADYADMLRDFAARGLPMVCANPDFTVERDGKIVYCAGALALEYEKLGGSVAYAGKPHLPIYDQALARLAEVKGREIAKEKILAIGDGVHTDIAGAYGAGIDSVFVASGVHLSGREVTAESIATLFPDSAVRPIAAMAGLAW